MRSCDGCTLCCRVLPVSQLKKPREVWCGYCEGGGCSIYPDRPGQCREWSCQWLKTQTIPTWMKPRESGVIIDTVPDTMTLESPSTGRHEKHPVAVFWVDVKRPRSWEKCWSFLQAFMTDNHVGGILRIGLTHKALIPPWISGSKDWLIQDVVLDRDQLPDFEKEAFGVRKEKEPVGGSKAPG